VITEPPELGAVQATIMFEPDAVVVGAAGFEGGYAARTYSGADGELYPTEFLASTLKL
jgi:hypothetical protein